MKGLILKDLLNLKKQASFYAIFVVFYLAIGLFSEGGNFFSGVVVVFFAMMPVTAMAFDERSGWDRFAASMFISRRVLVTSKYALGLLTSSIGAIVVLIINLIQGIAINDSLMTCGALLLVGIVWNGLLQPIMFKLGTEKGRVVMMIGLLVPALGIAFLNEMEISAAITNNLVYILPVMAIIVFVASYLISLSIYNKKEF